MKILFAVNNEKISKSIIKKYQNEYKEIISYKNVYYFNAILKELQKDNTYDRIIISEDLEPFTNNNYEQIDKFIFERLDNISDEATNTSRSDTPIILISSDRRTKSDEILIKLFSIGIYNALIGTDRNIDEICKLIKVPRTKKEAKLYYKIDSEEVTYQSESENDVSESEIQSILAHYKKIGRDEQKCVDSFDSIAQQYTDVQLKVIANFLPLNVKAILEESSPKYQQIMSITGGKANGTSSVKNNENDDNGLKIGFIETANSKKNLGRPVIIPSAVNTNNVKKMPSKIQKSSGLNIPEPIEPIIDSLDEDIVEPVEEVKPKRRGRPPKKKVEENIVKAEENEPKRRGRPPKKKVEEEIPTANVMPGFDDDDDLPVNSMPGFDDDDDDVTVNTMPGFDDDNDSVANSMPGFDDDDSSIINTMPGFDDNTQIDDITANNINNGYNTFNLNSSNGSNDYSQTKLTNTRRTFYKCVINKRKENSNFCWNK